MCAAGGYGVEAAKIFIDQTFYCFIYNMLYYVSTGMLKGHSLARTLSDFKDAAWRLQKAGWRLWPYVGLITHTIIPTQHKVLFVDAVEVVWVTYLSLSANATREKNVETVGDVLSTDTVITPKLTEMQPPAILPVFCTVINLGCG